MIRRYRAGRYCEPGYVPLPGIVRRLTALGLLVLLGVFAAPMASADTATLHVGDHRAGWQSLFKAAGVLDDVPYGIEWPQFAGGAPIIEAMNADAVDIGAMSDAPFLFGYASGAPVKAIQVLETRANSVGILVGPNSTIHRAADLQGKTVAAVRGSIADFLVVSSLEEAGLSADSVKFVYLNAPDAKAALVAGSIDAWATWEPYLSIGAETDRLRTLPYESSANTRQVFLVVTDQALRAKQALIRDFVARLQRAYQWAKAHPDDYARLYSAESGLSLDVAQRITSNQSYRFRDVDGSVIDNEQKIIRAFERAGLLQSPLDLAKAFDSGFPAGDPR